MDRLMIVSGDAHAALPVLKYKPYVDPEYRDQIDELVASEEEYERLIRWATGFRDEDMEFADPRGTTRDGGFDGRWDPKRRLNEMDVEGVTADIVHWGMPAFQAPWFALTNDEFSMEMRAAGSRAWNRWIHEYCDGGEGRLFPIAYIEPWPDMQAAVKQLEAAKAKGFVGASPTQNPGVDTPTLWNEYWDPFWAACADLGLPIDLHAGFGWKQGFFMNALKIAESMLGRQREAGEYFLNDDDGGGLMMEAPAADVQDAYDDPFKLGFNSRALVLCLIQTGAFDRYPGLKLVFTEQRADWVPGTLAAMDKLFDDGELTGKMKPSEYWQRHCAVTASSTRRHEVENRHEIGVERFMFGSDYPHPEGTWPNTREWLNMTFRDIPEADARLVLGENAVRFFNLDQPKLEKIAETVGPETSEILVGRDIDPRLVAHWNKRSGYDKPSEQVNTGEIARMVEVGVRETAKAS